jgi:hypothetical protein
VAGISYAVEVKFQGSNPAGEDAARGAASALARHGHGAVSPEDVSETWAPRGVHRVKNHRLPDDGFELLTLSWWAAGGPLVTPSGARRFFEVLQKWLPEAMPARWDEFEASGRRAGNDAEGLPNVLDAIRDQVVVLAPTAPILTLDFHGWHWGAHPNDGFQANWVQIAIDGGLLSEPGWPKQLARAFEELTVVAQPFYAEARLRPGGICDRSFGLAATTIHPIGRSCWRGFPHARPLAMAVGPPYVERWPRPTTAKERDGLLIFSGDDWPNAPRKGIPQAPSDMLQQFDQRVVPHRYIIEGPTEPPEFWPFEWGKVVDHSTSGGMSEMSTLIQSAAKAQWEKAKAAAGSAGTAPASATPLPGPLPADLPARSADGPPSMPTGRDAFADTVRTEASDETHSALEMYKVFVNQFFSPGLRALGFIGSAGRYEMPSDTCWVLLGLQKSKFSAKARVEFTINLKVVSKELWNEARAAFPELSERPTPNAVQWADLDGPTPPGQYPADYFSHRRGVSFPFERIGALGPRHADHWWPIETSTDLRALTTDVLENVELYGLPWLFEEVGRKGSQPTSIDP